MDRIIIPEDKVQLRASVNLLDHQVSIMMDDEDVTETRHSGPEHIGAISRPMSCEEASRCIMVVEERKGNKEIEESS